MCNEGKSPWKKRAFILFEDATHDHNTFVCHNCGVETNVETLVRHMDPVLHEDFVAKKKESLIRDLRDGKLNAKRAGRIANDFGKSESDLQLFNLNPTYFRPLTENRDAVAYCRSRKIPEAMYDRLYFCPKDTRKDGKKFMYYGMVIFPLWKGEKIYGFQGRSILEKKFLTFCKNDGFKVFNIFDVDLTSTVYCFESIIDSLAIDNSIAMLGSDLSEVIVDKIGTNGVYCFDNDRTGYNKSLKYLEMGKRVLCWPGELDCFKDSNQLLVQGGWTREKFTRMVKSNIVEGAAGVVKFKMKMMRRKR